MLKLLLSHVFDGLYVLILYVYVSPSDEHSSRHSAPSLCALLYLLPRYLWPRLLRSYRVFRAE